jgi:hypothetical protein
LSRRKIGNRNRAPERGTCKYFPPILLFSLPGKKRAKRKSSGREKTIESRSLGTRSLALALVLAYNLLMVTLAITVRALNCLPARFLSATYRLQNPDLVLRSYAPLLYVLWEKVRDLIPSLTDLETKHTNSIALFVGVKEHKRLGRKDVHVCVIVYFFLLHCILAYYSRLCSARSPPSFLPRSAKDW